MSVEESAGRVAGPHAVAVGPRRPAMEYGGAATCVAAAVLLKLAGGPHIGSETPFLLLHGAVLLAAWFGGLGPALFATGLSVLACNLLFLPPSWGLWPDEPGMLASLALFAAEGCAAGGLVSALRLARTRAEEALGRVASAEERHRLLLATAREGIWMAGADGRIEAVSHRLAEMLGAPADELIGRRIDEFLAPEDDSEVPASASLSGEPRRIRRRDESSLWAVIAEADRRDGAGRPSGSIGTLSDVTGLVRAGRERGELLARERLARAEAERSERRYRLLAEAMPAFVWTAGPDGRADFVNRRWTDYTGLDAAGTRGRGWSEVIHPDDLARANAAWERAFASGTAFEVEYRIRRATDGAFRWHLGRAVPVQDPDGGADRWLGVATDIDDRKRAEAELREARDVAEAASRAKDRFLGALGHELRTPLTPVLADVSAALDDPETPRSVRPVLELTRRNVAAEARLIEDLLDLSWIARDRLRLRTRRLDALAALRTTLDDARVEVEAARLRLVVSLDAAPGPAEVEADPDRLGQAFRALVRNAVKFTPPGGRVVVRAWHETGDGPGRLAVEVSDDGVGIAPEVLPRIFEPFERGSEARPGGLGLGLALCRWVVEAHGGRVEARSEGVDRGATFRVELPLAPAGAPAPAPDPGLAAGPPPAPAGPAASTPRLLLVEDDPGTLQVLLRLLRRKGFEVAPAASVAEALALGRGRPFDLLVSDIGLPDGSGLEVMRALGGVGLAGIAMSGFGTDDDARRSLEAGFAEHLVKPVTFGDLEAAIRRRLPMPSA